MLDIKGLVDKLGRSVYSAPMPLLQAPAKVNVRLKITGRRPDGPASPKHGGGGYHLLEMVMVPIDLYDEVQFELNQETISLNSDAAELPCDPTNTLWKIAELVRRESGKNFGVKIFLKKRIPTAAGLGGGSSDAASLLKGLNQSLGLGWGREKLIQLGLQIGADVPFFLSSGPQEVGGIGEQMRPLPLPKLSLLLVNPGFPVSTKDAYEWYDQNFSSPHFGKGGSGGILSRLTPLPLNAIPPLLENDLERVVIPRYPVLARIKADLLKAGALGALMSGSGPTVFGLFESPALRDRGYEKFMQGVDPRWWVCKAQGLKNLDSGVV